MFICILYKKVLAVLYIKVMISIIKFPKQKRTHDLTQVLYLLCIRIGILFHPLISLPS